MVFFADRPTPSQQAVESPREARLPATVGYRTNTPTLLSGSYREKFLADHAESIDAVTRLAIDSNAIFIGMSEGAAAAAWGLPDTINNSVTVSGTHRQLVYRGRDHERDNYIYTDDWIVTSWTN